MLAPMSPVRFAIACACLFGSACRRDAGAGPSDAAPSESTPPPPAPIWIRVATVAKDRAHVAITLVAPEIGLAQPVVDLAFPWTCQAETGQDSVFRVTCTPDVFHPVLVASLEPSSLLLDVRDARGAAVVTRLALPADRTASFENASVTSRAVEPTRCDDDAPLRDVDVALRAHGGRMELEAPGAGGPFAVAMRAPGDATCSTLVQENVSLRLRCGDRGPDCSLSVTDTAIHFDCTKPSLYAGMVLVPCGVRARLRQD
jgi:hypothetical protein